MFGMKTLRTARIRVEQRKSETGCKCPGICFVLAAQYCGVSLRRSTSAPCTKICYSLDHWNTPEFEPTAASGAALAFATQKLVLVGDQIHNVLDQSRTSSYLQGLQTRGNCKYTVELVDGRIAWAIWPIPTFPCLESGSLLSSRCCC